MRVVDLFCGCGGFSQAFQDAGFEIVQSFDHWKPAVATYRENFKHDIQSCEISSQLDLPSADVIIGGPPCQGFSSAGLRKQGDQRNSLVEVFSSLIVKHLPTAFVFENVEGFLTGEGGQHVFSLLDPLIEAGYQIQFKKVNASTFGVPQHRKRVIAIGGLGWSPSFPEHTYASRGAPGASALNRLGMPETPSVEEALQGLPCAADKRKGEQPEISDHVYTLFGEADQARAKLLKQGQRMRDLPEEYWHESYKQRANRRVKDGTPSERRGGAPSGLRRLIADEPSKAITGGALREFVHPYHDRPLTIRECARLQQFPDSFVFCGTQAEKIQMIGNAVPLGLGRSIAAGLFRDIKPAQPSSGQKGQLLSFIPTVATAMSPALAKLTQEVQRKFFKQDENVQESLCL
jgi:DNA (cytosine-5)-methyltransferase 1